MKLIDLLTKDERQQLRVRYDDASFPDYVNELLNKEVDTVKHGRWISDYEGQSFYKCSRCHTVYNYDHKYCPNCGACMD